MKTDNEMAKDVLSRAKAIKKRKKISIISVLCVVLVAGTFAGAMYITKGGKTPVGKDDTNNGTVEKAPYTAIAEPMVAQQLKKAEEEGDFSHIFDDIDPTKTEKFIAETSKALLGEIDGKNKVYSPLDLYTSLAMLAESTDGETRGQILDLLDVDNIEESRDLASKLLRGNYKDTDRVKCLPATSVWLNSSIFGNKYDSALMKTLAENYGTYSFSGDVGDERYSEAFREWLNEHTGNMLEGAVGKQKFTSDTVMTLASAVYFSGRWQDEFDPDRNITADFHGVNSDTETEFMYQSMDRMYYYDDKFSYVRQSVSPRGGDMYFILPDEGITPEELIEDGVISKLSDTYSAYCEVHLTVPKFDVTSDGNLKGVLEKLGVKDVFDASKADFSPTGVNDGLYVSQIEQASRVKIDEEGVEAASFTVDMLCGAALPDGEVDFTLDRPFIFVLESGAGIPLFIGIVNNM